MWASSFMMLHSFTIANDFAEHQSIFIIVYTPKLKKKNMNRRLINESFNEKLRNKVWQASWTEDSNSNQDPN